MRLDVNYHPPRVERLYTQIANYRLMLHIVHPCEPGEALYHPHPWPSAIHVLSGKYEMGLGVRHTPQNWKEITALRKETQGWEKYLPIDPTLKYVRDDNVVVREICRLQMDGNNYYEMLDAKGWHYVRPFDGPSISIMLIDTPFDVKDDQDIPKIWGTLPELSENRLHEILYMFRAELKHI